MLIIVSMIIIVYFCFSVGHLRWDSLGEYLALAVSFEHLGQTTNNQRALVLSKTLNQAIERLLQNRKSPGRKVNQLDNRASNFYVALYWAEFLAQQDPSFAPLATRLRDSRGIIVEELKKCQGKSVDLGGYYRFDPIKAEAAMRPSATFNAIIDSNEY
jgi:isocitrate dehydrogenase